MKKYLIAMTMLLSLGLTVPATAQKQQKKEQQELVDSAQKDNLEAYSDTTGVYDDDSTVVSSRHRMGGSYSVKVFDDDGIGGALLDNMPEMIVALLMVLVIFVISPLVILGLLFYFIFRNRKQKMQLAETAVKNGQPIPEQLLDEMSTQDDALWKKGIQQTALGVGLMIFLGLLIDELGIAIGALVACIGIGKLIIVKTTKKI